jgi:exonuclease III
MIVLSFNVIGLGGVLKRKKIRELVVGQKVDFLAIQETKMEVITDAVCRNLWCDDDFQWVCLPSVGNSGGILSIWRKPLATFIFSFVGEGLVGVCLEWGPLKRRCLVVNVYSKCHLLGKQRLWEKLVRVRSFLGVGAWCFIGDFKSVLHREERRG